MKKLTPIQASAKGESCDFMLPGCQNRTDQTVFCHDTRFTGKRCDSEGAYGDMHCHDIMDRRTKSELDKYMHGYEWDMAKSKTRVKLMAKGLLRFEGVENKPNKQLPRRNML